MTTAVKIEAHLSAEKEVKVTIMDDNSDTEEFTIQDGKTVDCHVYDGRQIIIKEVEKRA